MLSSVVVPRSGHGAYHFPADICLARARCHSFGRVDLPFCANPAEILQSFAGVNQLTLLLARLALAELVVAADLGM